MATKAAAKTKTANGVRELQASVTAAQKALTLAKKHGDAAEIGHCTRTLETAAGELTKLHTARFEALARELGRTATRAMDSITRLCEQRRYAITQGHRAAIMGAIDATRAELDSALEAACRHKPTRDTATGRAIVFGGAAHVS